MTQYEIYKKELESITKEISNEETECAKKGLSYEDMIEKTRDLRYKVYRLDKEMRLIQDPALQYNKEWKGELMPIEEFMTLCGTELTDNDGYGLYATETSVSDVRIYPSDVLEEKYRDDFTHVMWFDVITE